ncbi:hypothetical protein ES703_15775 [subsurface metagenome]
MGDQGKLSQWLKNRCHREHLSLRQAAARTGLSHQTLAAIIKGGHPLPETIRKLANAFGGNGSIALEDHLLALAGYRTERSGEELSKSMAQLMDKAEQLNEPQLEVMVRFADFLMEIENKR